MLCPAIAVKWKITPSAKSDLTPNLSTLKGTRPKRRGESVPNKINKKIRSRLTSDFSIYASTNSATAMLRFFARFFRCILIRSISCNVSAVR